MATNDVVELAKIDVITRLNNLETLVAGIDPLIPVHLTHIHKALIQYEELAHMLNDAQLAILLQARAKHMKIELVNEALNAKRGKKALNKTTLEDI